MIILAVILVGMVAGAIAQWVIYPNYKIWWPEAFAVGIGGSFLGGLISSLIAGDGFSLQPLGLIGSSIGAIVLLWLVKFVRQRMPA